jgi:tRNA1Val (adenine37-N6)-methyltransferase
MSVFQFQQFSVRQKHSGMKVCTDALVFGSMAPVRGGEYVLDAGTGTGLLALIAAQKGARFVETVEIIEAALIEARENFQRSSWSGKMRAVHGDMRDYVRQSSKKYDLIICNPPFFPDYAQITDETRRTARCNHYLTMADLVRSAQDALTDSGCLYVLAHKDHARGYERAGSTGGLHLNERVGIRSYANRPSHVFALTFNRIPTPIQDHTLTIYEAPGVYTEQSARLLGPFLLRFSNKTE